VPPRSGSFDASSFELGYKRRLSMTRALAHPIPQGLRDLLPEQARRRRTLTRRVIDHFALHGYALVTPPAFEFADVVERGLGASSPADLLRFVEPESGEVAALRPDMTPQIARMVATRLSDRPVPMRLCYEGTVVRRRLARARRHRQVPQTGVELFGTDASHGDAELIRLAVSTMRAAGLEDFVLDVGHAGISRALVDACHPDDAAFLTEALRRKDQGAIDDRLRRSAAPVAPAVARALLELPTLHGGGASSADAASAFRRAGAALEGTAAESALAELRALWDELSRQASLAEVLRIDLGEVRGFSYYTGIVFQAFAEGPGEPVLAGGRYDDLLARFGVAMPAVGFGLNLDALAWACSSAGVVDEEAPRVVVTGDLASNAAVELRARGIACMVHGDGAFDFARAWGCSHVLQASEFSMRLLVASTDVVATIEAPFDGSTFDELVGRLQAR